MKKKISILAVLVMAVAATAYCVSGTYAKYTTSESVSGGATIAKWNIAMKANGNAITDSTTINLADAMKDTAEDNDEANVAPGKIAPGTKGTFNFGVDGTGTEVDYTYTITLDNFTNVPTNFVISAATGTTVTKTGSIADGNLKYVITGTIARTATEKNITSALNWIWAYETTDGDAADTANGEAADADRKMTFNVTINATQVD